MNTGLRATDGWEDYEKFSLSVRDNLRYVRSVSTNAFLEKVRSTCVNRKRTIDEGSVFWRAQIGHNVTEEHGETCSLPYENDRMKPRPNLGNENRANPRGIPYLYMATGLSTAIAEIRPWIGSVVSVAEMHATRDLVVIDCSSASNENLFTRALFDSTIDYNGGMWLAINQAFAVPVNRDDDTRAYIPTQILAELFKCDGFDGIVYNSGLSKSRDFNIAIFNLDNATVASTSLCKVESIDFTFTPPTHRMRHTEFR